MRIRYLLLLILFSSCTLHKNLLVETTSVDFGLEREPTICSIMMEDTTITYQFQSKFYKKYTVLVPSNYDSCFPYVCSIIPNDFPYDEKTYSYRNTNTTAVFYISTCFNRLPENMGNAKILKEIQENMIDIESAIECESYNAFILAKTGEVLASTCFCDIPNVKKGHIFVDGEYYYWKDFRVYDLVIGYYNATKEQKNIFDKCIEGTIIRDF